MTLYKIQVSLCRYTRGIKCEEIIDKENHSLYLKIKNILNNSPYNKMLNNREHAKKRR